MLNLGIYLRVKFRVFGITLGTVEKAYTLSVSTQGQVSAMEIPANAPDHAKTLYNDRGIVLKAW